MSPKRSQRRLEGATFKAPKIEHTKAIRGHHLARCTFERCFLTAGFFAKHARVVSNVTIEHARVKQGAAERLHLRDVVIDGCDADQAVRLENVRFDRVVLRGDVGRWHVSDNLYTQELVTEKHAFYEKVEWALDIREARFADAILRGIPVDKVRRDPARHFVLRKDKLRADDGWRRLSKPIQNRVLFWLGLPRSRWEDASLAGESELLVANDSSPAFERELERYRALRDAGYAD